MDLWPSLHWISSHQCFICQDDDSDGDDGDGDEDHDDDGVDYDGGGDDGKDDLDLIFCRKQRLGKIIRPLEKNQLVNFGTDKVINEPESTTFR